MMDKKFIDDLKECSVKAEYQCHFDNDKECETYVLRSWRLEKMLKMTNDEEGWDLKFMEDAECLNIYSKEEIFKIFELIKNKVA